MCQISALNLNLLFIFCTITVTNSRFVRVSLCYKQNQTCSLEKYEFTIDLYVLLGLCSIQRLRRRPDPDEFSVLTMHFRACES